MSEYIVGLDALYQVSADSPEEAEVELARRIAEGEIQPTDGDVVTYEELPE